MKRLVVYCRVSTAEQTTQNQELAIRKYCESQGWNLHKIYTDVGISGSKDSRPQLDKLKSEVAKGKVGCVMVYKFDRLARSTSHLLDCLKLFQKHGVDFISVTEGIDTSTSIGKMIFTFLGAIAEFERELIRERVKAGLDRAKSNDVKLGRPRVGFDINEALALKQSGLSWSELSKRMNVSSATLRRSLTTLLKNLKV